MRMAQALAKDRKAAMALLAGAQASRLDALLAGSAAAVRRSTSVRPP